MKQLLMIGVLLAAMSVSGVRAEDSSPHNIQFIQDIPTMVWQQEANSVEFGYSDNGQIHWIEAPQVETSVYAMPLGNIPYGKHIYLRANQVVYGPFLYGQPYFLPLVTTPVILQ